MVFAQKVDAVRKHPLISVVIITYNRSRKLASCLDSIINQESPPTYEVVVVDHGSQDDTRQTVISRGLRYHFCDRQSARRPRQVGVGLSRGKYVVFIDDDAIADARWLLSIGVRVRRGHVGVIGGAVLNLNKTIGGHAVHLFDFGELSGSERTLRNIATVNACYDKKYLIKHKFDDSILYGEDVDLNWRLRESGILPRFCPEMRVAHATPGFDMSVLRKRSLQGYWYVLLRRKHPSLPPQPHNKYWMYLASPVYVVGIAFLKLTRPYSTRHLLLSAAALPLVFIQSFAFWVGVLNCSFAGSGVSKGAVQCSLAEHTQQGSSKRNAPIEIV